MTRPVPTEVKLRNGNPGKRAIPQPRPVGGRVQRAPDPPAGLTREEQRLWRSHVAPLVHGGVYDRVDRTPVKVIVRLERTFDRICRMLNALSDAELVAYNEQTGIPHKHPLLTAQVELAGALRLAAAEMGEGAVARTRLPKRPPEDVEDDIAKEIGPSPRLRVVGRGR
jgi:phage terminase small subunit